MSVLSRLAQADGIPLGGFRPTTSWRVGEALVDRHSIELPSDLPAGEFVLWVGLYDPNTGQRMPIGDTPEDDYTDRVLLTEINVVE